MEAVVSGCLAALSAVLGKLAFDSETVLRDGVEVTLPPTAFEWGFFAARVVCFVLMFASNIAMIKVYLVSMERHGSLQATVLNSATNYIAAGAMGYLVFRESLPLLWWVGCLFISGGVYVVTLDSATSPKSDEKRD